MRKRLFSLFLVLALTASIFAGCNTPPGSSSSSQPGASSSTSSTAPVKDTVSMALYSDLSTFDPHNSGMTLDRVIYRNIFDTLLVYYNGEFENVLIDKYELSDDGTVYTFYLKHGVKFHNGEELKASDVVFTMNRAKESSQMSNYTKRIVETKAVDDYTVSITLSEPYVPFLNAVAAQVSIMNEKATTEAGDKINIKPIGTGPYKFVKWDAGSQVVLERFDDYHGEKPAIKTATYVIITDPSAALIALENGEIDLSYNIPSVSVAELKNSDKVTLSLNPTLGSGYIVYNIEKPFLNDLNFRLAMSYAINREEVIELGMDGVGVLSTAIWNQDTVGYSGQYKPVEYNLEKAKEYLAKTNYKGEAISFKVGYENYKKIGVVIQEQLKKVGINISVELLEANTWVSMMKSGDFDMSTIVQTPGPDVDMWSTIWHSNAIGGYNFTRLDNPEVDKAFETGASILDPAERAKAYSAIEKVFYEDAVVIPLYYRVIASAHNPKLVITRNHLLGFAEVKDMSWKA